MTRVYGVIFVGFTRESISPLVGAFAGNVNAVGDTNITQLFDVVDRLQSCVIISREIGNDVPLSGCAGTWQVHLRRERLFRKAIRFGRPILAPIGEWRDREWVESTSSPPCSFHVALFLSRFEFFLVK